MFLGVCFGALNYCSCNLLSIAEESEVDSDQEFDPVACAGVDPRRV